MTLTRKMVPNGASAGTRSPRRRAGAAALGFDNAAIGFGAAALAFAVGIAAFATTTLPAAAQAEGTAQSPAPSPPQLSRIDQIGPAILGCWRPPAGAEGSQATVMFSLNRSGAVIGKPKLTFVKLVGDADTQQRFAASVTQAMANCTPLALSPRLGAAIAGEVFTLRFVLENRGA